MYCPKCHAEYREGFTQCSDCRVPLVLEKPPTEAIEPTGEVNLDALILTGLDHPIAIALAESLLREAGIPYFVPDQDVTARQEGGNALGWWDVRVPRDRESEAREIIESVGRSK